MSFIPVHTVPICTQSLSSRGFEVYISFHVAIQRGEAATSIAVRVGCHLQVVMAVTWNDVRIAGFLWVYMINVHEITPFPLFATFR